MREAYRKKTLTNLKTPHVSLEDQIAYNFTFVSETANALSIPSLPCETEYEADKDAYGYDVDPKESCGCELCEKKCDPVNWDTILHKPSFLYGFQLKSIYLVVFLLLLTALAYFWSAYRKRTKRARSDSVDSYERIKDDLKEKS